VLPFSAAAGIRVAIAVFLGAVTWMMVTWEQNPFREDWLPGTVPVEVTHIPNGVVEVGKPGDVRVRLRAAQDVWSQVQSSDFKASVDASHLSAGIQSADVKIESSRDIDVVDWQPRRVTIRLEPLATRTIPVQLQVTGKLPDGFLLTGQSVSPEEVSVSGEQDLVDTLSQATVATSLDGVRGDVSETSTPKLVDDKGQPVPNLQFSPASVRVSLAIDRQVGVKTVPVRVSTAGQVASGYWLSAFTVNPQTVTITGGPTALGQVDFIDLPPLDLSGAKADVSRTTALSAGAGYSLLNDVSVEVKATVQPLRTTEVLPIGVAVQGVPSGLQAQLDPANIEVTIGGLVPALSALKPGDVSAVVDASGLAPGPHTVPVRLNAPGSVSLDATRPDRVTVTLAAPTTETPTPPAPSPTVAASPTTEASPTARPSATPSPSPVVASATASPGSSVTPGSSVAATPNASPSPSPSAAAKT
jgi:YbbR domain-containing protein